jgi:hypothetical protein
LMIVSSATPLDSQTLSNRRGSSTVAAAAEKAIR